MSRSYERASTGRAGLDKVLDQLRLGDNVVWQVDRIEEYQHFVQPFIERALEQGRKLVYFRFGQHPPVVAADPRITVYHLNPEDGFEAFSGQVHAAATLEGQGVFYVFDCLSDLLSAWATDLMIGNFFRVTCPYLFELNTIAYFTVLRGRNSYQTIARIRETTQLLLDVYHFEGRYYVHPLKVWNRYSPTMFLPHVDVGGDFLPVTSSVETSRLFSHFRRQGPGDTGRKLDYWDRVFLHARQLLERKQQSGEEDEPETAAMVEQLCHMLIGREERVLKLARRYFSLDDLLNIHRRLIGSGYIGGKAVGMMLARAILGDGAEPDHKPLLESHDSFFIGSDVYYTYLVENGCWQLRLEQKREERYFEAAAELQVRIKAGMLAEIIREQFLDMMDYFGQSPIIIRSSSLLEDAFGNAFAGKYESVFCVNQGSPGERFQLFEEAVKSVFASTMSEDALAYRRQRGLAQKDEQMALLVQRVSGSYHKTYFFPDLAGVAMSYNPYVWNEDLDPDAGMMRLVVGLGTRAVDRVDDDYPRLVALDQPLLRPDSTIQDIQRFSQHKIDLLDLVSNAWKTESIAALAKDNLLPAVCDQVAVPDLSSTQRLRELGRGDETAWVITFEKLFRETDFAQRVRNILNRLEGAYQYPVDVEFTANLSPAVDLDLNLLQCRPLQTNRPSVMAVGQQPDLIAGRGQILFSSRGHFMGSDHFLAVDRIIYIRPETYNRLSVAERYQVARQVGKLNRLQKGREAASVMLIGPGRWGTTTPSLGIPVSFAEICNMSVLIELGSMAEGFMPELSYGTHFFQDLVESRIFYIALFPGREDSVFNESMLDSRPNRLSAWLPEQSNWQEVIHVLEASDLGGQLLLDADFKTRMIVCYPTGKSESKLDGQTNT